MPKKIIFFSAVTALLILWCSPLWALDTQPTGQWPQTESSKLGYDQPSVTDFKPAVRYEELLTSPLDFCFTNPFATSCVNGCFAAPFPGGWLWRYQDPALTCPAPVYPFQVTQITVELANCGTQACTLLISGGIFEVGTGIDTCDNGKICRTPGKQICQAETVFVILLGIPGLCTTVVLDIPDTCCVNGPYYAGIDLCLPPLSHGNCSYAPCFDNSPDTCFGSWYWDCLATSDTLNVICELGFQTNLCINSFGFTDPQNPCDGGPPPDTGNNHFKTWRVFTAPKDTFAFVRDQFIETFATGQQIKLDSIPFLSNPARKDTFDILRPFDHLNWYRASGTDTFFTVEYTNQFESTCVVIDTLKYLLVPAQKQPLPTPVGLDHYICYRIDEAKKFVRPTTLKDQFDSLLNKTEFLDTLLPVYFCTPAQKNAEPTFDTITHYVAYSFTPDPAPVPTQITNDQFGSHPMQILQSEMLLVPTDKKKFAVCDAIPGDANASGTITLGDAIAIVNYVFGKPGCLPLPLCWLSGKLCRGDVNGSCTVTLADAIWLVNFIFAKPCPAGAVVPTPCCWKPIPCPCSPCCLPNPVCP